jgi:hypothetical protein
MIREWFLIRKGKPMNRGIKRATLSIVALVAFFCLTLLTDARAQEANRLPEPEIASKKTVEGRLAIRYEHKSKIPWGYEASQENYFNFIPAKAGLKNAPLRVVLHSSGGSADASLRLGFEKHYVLQFVNIR